MEKALIASVSVPVAMLLFNALGRFILHAQQSSATDLTFLFVTYDFSLVVDPSLAERIIHSPSAFITPSYWTGGLMLASILLWWAMISRLEKPLVKYYFFRDTAAVGAPSFPFFRWAFGWALAGVLAYFHIYLFVLSRLE